MATADASFMVRGTSDQLYVKISPDYINFKRATFAIKIISVAVQLKPTKVFETDEYVYVNHVSASDNIECLMTLVCNEVRGKYMGELGLIDRPAPLAHLNISLSEGKHFLTKVNSEWMQLNRFMSGELNFHLKNDINSRDSVQLDKNIIEIHFMLRREKNG